MRIQRPKSSFTRRRKEPSPVSVSTGQRCNPMILAISRFMDGGDHHDVVKRIRRYRQPWAL